MKSLRYEETHEQRGFREKYNDDCMVHACEREDQRLLELRGSIHSSYKLLNNGIYYVTCPLYVSFQLCYKRILGEGSEQ